MPASRPVLLFDVFKTLLVFDGDHVDAGTFAFLADWLRYRQVFIEAPRLEQRFWAITRGQLEAAGGEAPDVDVRRVWEALLAEAGVPAARRDALASELALTYRQITTREIGLWPGTRAMLDACAADFRLAIASNTQRAYTEAELSMLGLWDDFELVLFSSDVLACKPDPALFRAALEALDCPADNVIYVGDNPFDDVLGARQLGIPTILLDRGTPAPEGVALPTPLATLQDGDPLAVARIARQHFGLESAP
ncbi:HAD family hydrolase [Halomonas sp. PAMB 3264]|uniref:HAD family hydrolase n=1 Tax=Halomonas sp. PAMB 3264 TaxID=3075222 RepID=UPI0028991A2B|nr:HAD family hydrolase [Halomonas sp. PAMB 3264]WNL42526.1 HAD family hydrolase [Halomonas sp. PAMB 3264]